MPPHSNDSDWIDEYDWHIKRRETNGYKRIKFDAITIQSDYWELWDINTECRRKRSIEPLNKLNLKIPAFHFSTTEHRLRNYVDIFQGYIIYCIFDGTILLYVGKTGDIRTRILYHPLMDRPLYIDLFAENITVEGFFVNTDADLHTYELFSINTLKPLHNIHRVYTY